MKIKIVSFTFLSVFLFSSCWADTPKTTLDNLITLALKNNTSLKNARTTTKIYEYQIRQYWGSVYPNINLNASYTRNLELPSFFINGQKVKIGSDNNYSFSAELEQNLYTGGAVSAGIKIASIYGDIGVLQEKIIRNELIRNIRNLFFDVVLSYFTVQVQGETYNLSKEYLKEIKDKYGQGLSSDLDVLRQSVEVSNLLPSVIEAESVYDVGILNLNNLAGNEPEAKLHLDFKTKDFSSSLSFDIDELYSAALKNRPDIKQARLMYDMSTENIKVKKAAFYPELKLFANRTFQGTTNGTFPNNNERYWSSAVGLKLKWNIFSGLADAAEVRQVELESQKNYESLQETIRLAKIEVKRYWLDYQKAKELVSSQKEAVSQARKALKATETRFKNGLSSRLELNDAVLAFNKAALLEINAVNEKSKSLSNIIWAIGGETQ